MEYADLGRVLLSFLFVLILMLVIAFIARKLGLEKRLTKAMSKGGSIAIREQLYLDAKHRLIIIERGKQSHLVLLGATYDTVIESFPTTPADDDA